MKDKLPAEKLAEAIAAAKAANATPGGNDIAPPAPQNTGDGDSQRLREITQDKPPSYDPMKLSPSVTPNVRTREKGKGIEP